MTGHVAVVTFPGSNGDADARRALERCGLRARAVWHGDDTLDGAAAVVLPGGFSHGDYLRPGALARFAPVLSEVRRFAARGGPVLGICNGFQILCECGLLPGVLLRNEGLRFLCQDVRVEVCGRSTPFTVGLRGALRLPIAHQDGRWYADDDTRTRLADEGRIVLRYLGGAPNGSVADAAGVCSAEGNVVGLMPHPERYVEEEAGGTDGTALFGALRASLGGAWP